MVKQWIVLLITTTFLLASCHFPVYNQTQGNVADVKIKAADARKKSDESGKPAASLVVKDGLYVDTAPISLERQPQWLRNHIVIRGDQLPFSYYSRTVANGAGSSVLTKYQTGLDQAVTVSVSYSGTVKGALDLIASKTGYVYSIRGNSIYWQAFITKTLDIAFMPGDTDYMMGKASGGGSGGSSGGGGGGGSSGGTTTDYTTSDSSDSEYSSLSGKLSLWKDLQTTISQLISKDGRVTVSQATTTVTVRDRPTNVQLVEQYIRNLNANLSKQVLIKVQVLEVQLEDAFNLGLDWQMIAKAFHNSPFIVNGNYGTPITISNILSGQTGFNGQSAPTYPQFGTQGNGNIPSYTILFNALSQQGKTSVVTEPRVVCLNNQVSVIRIVDSEGYIASIQNTSTGGGGTTTAAQNTVTSQITPGTVITGLTLYILPKIMGKDVYMQVNADLSTNRGIVDFTTGSGDNASTVQLPNITEKHFNQRSVIRSGETLIMAGFRQVINQANANQFLNSQSLGGKGAQQINKETIILITPILLSTNGTA